MERRNRSLKALDELKYISYLDEEDKAKALVDWTDEYLVQNDIKDFDLELKDLNALSELFYSNVEFLYKKKDETNEELLQNKKLRKFMLNS